jgi:WD40 repeat protein
VAAAPIDGRVAHVAVTPPGGAAGELPPEVRLAKPDGHLATIGCVAFSPDGRHLVTGSDDRSLLVWDLARGEIVQRLEGHQAYVSRCSYLLDGRRIVSGGAWGEIILWDALDGEITGRLTGLGTADDLTALALRPDGHELLAGTYTGKLMAWDLRRPGAGTEDAELMRDKKGRAFAAGWLDGQRRFGGSGDRIRIAGEAEAYPTAFDVIGAVPLPGGRLITAGGTGVYLSTPPAEAPRLIARHEGNLEAIAVSAARQLVVAVDRKGHARVWGLDGGAARCDLAHATAFRTVALDASGGQFAAGAEDGVTLVARTSDCAVIHRFVPARGRIRAVAAGSSVLLGDGTGRVSAWSIDAWRSTRSEAVHVGEVTTVALLPDGRWLSGGLDSMVFLGPSSAPRKLASLSWFPWQVEPKLDEGLVLIVDESGRAVAQPLDGSASRDFAKNDGGLYAVAVRPGRNEVLLGGRTRSLYKLDGPLSSGARASVWLEAGHSVTTLVYTADGRFSVEGSTRGDVVVRDADTGAAVKAGKVRTQVTGLVATDTHVWASTLGGELFQLPLEGEFAPTLSLPEGSGMYDLARTADGRFLVAGLDNGAAVHALPGGQRVAWLIPMRDGSWASVRADRRFVASGGAALGLRVEDPRSRRVATLGNLLAPAAIGAISAERLGAGPARVRAAVFSRSGAPHVRLDGQLLVALAPSPSSLPAYELELLLADPTAGEHTLEVIPPEGAPARATFRAPPAVGVGSARALVIGNERYAHDPAPAGAGDDARALAEGLRREDGWQLVDLKPRLDLRGADLEQTIAAFFADAAPGETLLLHFAGLGRTEAGESFLLPVDHDGARLSPRLSLTALWGSLAASRAGQVVVVLDACRGGAFKLPAAIEKQAEARRALFLTCGAPGGRSLTRAILDAMRDPAHADARIGAVTVRSAFLHAGGAGGAREVQLQGDHGLADVILAHPSDLAHQLVATAVPVAGAVAAGALADADATLEARPGGEASALVVRARFAEDAAWLRVTLRQVVGGGARPALQLAAPGGGRYRKGQRATLRVPLGEAVAAGCYRVEVEGCAPGATCGGGPALRFALRLPDGGACP